MTKPLHAHPKRELRSSSGRHAAPREGRSRLLSLGAVCALVAVSLVGSAGAAPTTDTTAVAFVDIPAKQIWGNNSVNPGKFESVVVIGGTTTVPTNATTVRLQVTVKGTAAGSLKFYPAGNEAGGAGHTLSWTAGGTNTTVTNENVGMQNKVSVFNTSTKAAVVTIKVTGYSTQVTAGDINGSGGTAGQVLTNNGTGGAQWRTPNPAYSVQDVSGPVSQITAGGVIVEELFLPAGSYQLSGDGFFASLLSGSPTTISCGLVSPGGADVSLLKFGTSANWDTYVPMSLQGLLTTNGGNAKLFCRREVGTDARFYFPSLTAVRVGSVNGPIGSASSKAGPMSETLPVPDKN